MIFTVNNIPNRLFKQIPFTSGSGDKSFIVDGEAYWFSSPKNGINRWYSMKAALEYLICDD